MIHKILETDFFKSLSNEKKKIVWSAWLSFNYPSDVDDVYVQGFCNRWKYELERRDNGLNQSVSDGLYGKHKTYGNEYFEDTYHVVDHPNDDPDGFKKFAKSKKQTRE